MFLTLSLIIAKFDNWSMHFNTSIAKRKFAICSVEVICQNKYCAPSHLHIFKYIIPIINNVQIFMPN